MPPWQWHHRAARPKPAHVVSNPPSFLLPPSSSLLPPSSLLLLLLLPRRLPSMPAYCRRMRPSRLLLHNQPRLALHHGRAFLVRRIYLTSWVCYVNQPCTSHTLTSPMRKSPLETPSLLPLSLTLSIMSQPGAGLHMLCRLSSGYRGETRSSQDKERTRKTPTGGAIRNAREDITPHHLRARTQGPCVYNNSRSKAFVGGVWGGGTVTVAAHLTSLLIVYLPTRQNSTRGNKHVWVGIPALRALTPMC